MTAEIPQNVKIAAREVLKIVDTRPWALAFDLSGPVDRELLDQVQRQIGILLEADASARPPLALIWFDHDLQAVRPISHAVDLRARQDVGTGGGTNVDRAGKAAAQFGAQKLVVVTDGWVDLPRLTPSGERPGWGAIDEIFWVLWKENGRTDLPGLSLPMYAMHEPERPDFERPVYAIGTNYEGGIDWLNPMLPCRVISRNRIAKNHWSYVLLAREHDGPKGDQEHVLICNPETGEAASQFQSYRIINKLRPA